jgi:hypothetical protein
MTPDAWRLVVPGVLRAAMAYSRDLAQIAAVRSLGLLYRRRNATTDAVEWATASTEAVDATDDGLAGDRTTGGSYQTQTVIVRPRGIVRLTTIKWDVTAGTYTLTVDGTSWGAQTRADTGTLTWTGDQVLHGPAIFALVRSTAAATVRDASAGVDHVGDLVILPNQYAYDTDEFAFRPAIRVTGRRVKVTGYPGL